MMFTKASSLLAERMTGFEPATPTLARWCSSQLSYIRMNYQSNSVRDTGLEPVTSSVSGKRANQLRQSRLCFT